ncbi:xylulokinase [Labrys wisconsinensis]|uniref:Xylulokinase n=1 Tax=Labrys wisconsinensis TaxID=425677 RepID=A0ABU0JMG7_9HYPH|nr:FGGY family carbohydrate kinase [Labrys wisconsinensis]MDQ0474464.1 xylulokinase [Labrys wisconsinensis]
MRDLVIGVDASTTGVKAIAFDRGGAPVAEARAAYPLSMPLPGHVEQDAEDWWSALSGALRTLVAEVGAARIGALAIGHQRETFVFVDAAGHPLAPAILWLDERARPQVARLSAAVGRERLRDLSGKPPDPTPALYGIAWMAEHRPQVVAAAHAVLDAGGFLIRRLTGRLATSVPSADPLGLVHVETGAWDETLVAAAGLRPAQLPALVAPGAVIATLTAEAAALTGLAPDTAIVAGAGDGQMAGLGVGAIDEATGYLSLGSGVVTGLFGRDYRTADAHRTLASPTGRGFMFETVLRSGMQLVEWTVRTLRPPAAGAASDLEALQAAALAVPPGSGGLMVLPYWAGVMNPYWDEAARGVVLGLTLDHTPAHLFRAALEGIAYEQHVTTHLLEASVGRRPERFIACGGGTKSPLLMAVMAAVLERPLAVSPVNEAVALGAGVLAAAALGWHGSIEAAAAAMVAPPTRIVEPDPALTAAYAPRIAIYRDVFAATSGVAQRLYALGTG